MHKALITIATIGLAACSQSPAQLAAAERGAVADQAGLAKELAGLVPTNSSGCLSNIETRSSTQVRAYGPTIVYSVSPRLKYRSDTTGGCERIARGDTLVTVTAGAQLCQGDIARTVDQVARFQTGSCSFGEFVRYERPDKSS